MNSEHFRDGRFFNPGAREHSFSDFLRWITHRNRSPWRKWSDSVPGPKPPERVEDDGLRATFVNHSTVLLQMNGLNFLTDPVWSMRASPFSWMGPKRHRAPGIRFEDLPPIDCVLLSHNHYDHMDTQALRRLAKRDRPEIFCPLGLARPVRKLGFTQVHELDWWQHREWRGVDVHAVPAQHFSSRTPFDRNRTLWCGWVVESQAGAVYFAADTGFGPLFGDIAARFPHLRLSLLPIGSYKPEWFMAPVHVSPDEALDAHRILKSRFSIATHFGTFSLADEGQDDPVERLQALLGEAPSVNPFRILQEGEGCDVPLAR